MTKKVTCTLPNASEEINGVKFSVIEGGVVAAGLSDDKAAQFAGIPGYAVEDESPPMTAAEKKAAAKAKREAEEAEEAAAAEAAAAETAAAAAAAAAGGEGSQS